METLTASELRNALHSEAARTREAFEAEKAARMARTDAAKQEPARYVHTDQVAGVLGEFPELTAAVREGDVSKVSALCERLFASNSSCNTPHPQPCPISS